jgi:hypothetical protein
MVVKEAPALWERIDLLRRDPERAVVMSEGKTFHRPLPRSVD